MMETFKTHDEMRDHIDATPIHGLTFGDCVGDWLSADAWDEISYGETETPLKYDAYAYVIEEVCCGFISVGSEEMDKELVKALKIRAGH